MMTTINKEALEAALAMCSEDACTFSLYEGWTPSNYREAACVLAREAWLLRDLLESLMTVEVQNAHHVTDRIDTVLDKWQNSWRERYKRDKERY